MDGKDQESPTPIVNFFCVGKPFAIEHWICMPPLSYILYTCINFCLFQQTKISNLNFLSFSPFSIIFSLFPESSNSSVYGNPSEERFECSYPNLESTYPKLDTKKSYMLLPSLLDFLSALQPNMMLALVGLD